LLDIGCLFCIYEIVIEKSSIRVSSNAAHF